MDELIMEYLVTIENKNGFCKDEEGFTNLLRTISEVTINDKVIVYNNININYNNILLQKGDKTNRIFHINFTLEDYGDSNIQVFEKFLKEIRSVFYKVSYNREVITLSDGLSNYYGTKAYPIIHKIENLMRKLLTQFMFVNIGEDWDKDNIPQKVSDALERKKENNTYDYLYQADFIHLSDFLFTQYTQYTQHELYEKLQKSNDIEELKKYIPQSNWKKYFENIVRCEGEELKNKWEKIYKLRCNVAHNNKFDRTDYNNLLNIVKSIEPILLEAIQELDNITIEEEEKQELSVNLISSFNENYARFLSEYRIFEKWLILYCNQNGIEDCYNIRDYIEALKNKKIIDSVIYESFKEICNYRNILVHNGETSTIVERQILNFINLMKTFVESLFLDDIDTIVVPARKSGFDNVFLKENCWHAIRISELMIEKIKYIAAYQVAPISAITHIAEVSKIERYKDSEKYIVYFKEKAKEIKKISLMNPRYAVQSPRYTNSNKLLMVMTIEQLFGNDELD